MFKGVESEACKIDFEELVFYVLNGESRVSFVSDYSDVEEHHRDKWDWVNYGVDKNAENYFVHTDVSFKKTRQESSRTSPIPGLNISVIRKTMRSEKTSTKKCHFCGSFTIYDDIS